MSLAEVTRSRRATHATREVVVPQVVGSTGVASVCRTPCPYGGNGETGTGTGQVVAQVVNGLPMAQASLRDEFVGTVRDGDAGM
jgi:hypothetical protein